MVRVASCGLCGAGYGLREMGIGHSAERKKMEDGMVRWREGEKRLDRCDDGKKVPLNT